MVLRRLVMDALSVDYHPQREIPLRDAEHGLEALDARIDRSPDLIGSDEVLEPEPLPEGELEREVAAKAMQELDGLVPEKRCIQTKVECHRAAETGAQRADQIEQEARGPGAVVGSAAESGSRVTCFER